jgi:mRNA-degrading endonuclease RelE of RelBE toxin-antitoxin system
VASKRFKVIFNPSAQKEVESLDTDDAVRFVKEMGSYLEISPFPFGETRIKKLTGFDPPLYRLRSGVLRAYYHIVAGKVIILAVTHG